MANVLQASTAGGLRVVHYLGTTRMRCVEATIGRVDSFYSRPSRHYTVGGPSRHRLHLNSEAGDNQISLIVPPMLHIAEGRPLTVLISDDQVPIGCRMNNLSSSWIFLSKTEISRLTWRLCLKSPVRFLLSMGLVLSYAEAIIVGEAMRALAFDSSGVDGAYYGDTTVGHLLDRMPLPKYGTTVRIE